MTNLETELSRRLFLHNLGNGVGILLLGHNSAISEPQRKISFKEASTDETLRPDYIDQLVEREFNNEKLYFNVLSYDHDKFLATEKIRKNAERMLNDPEFLKIVISDYLNNPRFKDFSPELRREQIVNFFNSSEGKDELRKIVRQHELTTRINAFIDNPMAITMSYDLNFGNGEKPDIFLFPSVFYDYLIQGKVMIATEEFIRGTLRHEYFHARDISKGIELYNDLKIDRLNYYVIKKNVCKFIMETRANMYEIEFLKYFGESHPAFLVALHSFKGYMDKNSNFESEKLTDYESRLITYQMKKVRDMFRKFRI